MAWISLSSRDTVRSKRSEIVYYMEDMEKLQDLTRDELEDVLHEAIKILTLPDVEADQIATK